MVFSAGITAVYFYLLVLLVSMLDPIGIATSSIKLFCLLLMVDSIDITCVSTIEISGSSASVVVLPSRRGSQLGITASGTGWSLMFLPWRSYCRDLLPRNCEKFQGITKTWAELGGQNPWVSCRFPTPTDGEISRGWCQPPVRCLVWTRPAIIVLQTHWNGSRLSLMVRRCGVWLKILDHQLVGCPIKSRLWYNQDDHDGIT